MQIIKSVFLRNAAIPLVATALCIFYFGVYGWFEFTGRSYTLWDSAKHWSAMGAFNASENITRIASARNLWDREYPEIGREDVLERFSLKDTEPKVKLWMPKYLNNILMARVLNDIEKRYSNKRFRSFIMDAAGYVPTGRDRYIGGDSVWEWYTGDETKDSVNFSHRFSPVIRNIDSILSTIYEKNDTGYVGSQIVINDRVWGYFVVSFDIKELKIIRDEIIRRIVMISLFVGITLSLVAKQL